jgi:FAD/FMN-containing dehydrogenase
VTVSTTTTRRPTGFRGSLFRPGDDGYDDARRIWNGAIDRRPALIARCADEADVVSALAFARESGLPLAVRSGGHGVAGYAIAHSGVVIDLSALKGIAVDPSARTARAQAGVLLGELDAATQRRGLAAPAGIVTHTGLAGLTLGGGIGWLMRRHGATVDNLLSARVVTADGEVVTASERDEPDLFWALRGGGGNFGIVTEFELRLHEVGPAILGGPVYYALEEGASVLRAYRDAVAEAPDALTTILNLRRIPPLPFLPEELHGRHAITVSACWCGDLDEGERVVRPLRALGTPLADLLVPRPFVELQRLFDAAVPHGWHYYWRSLETPPFSGDAIDALVEQTARITSPLSYTIVFQLGGALARVPGDATAYPQRDAAFNVNVNAAWLGGDERAGEHVRWARNAYDALAPHSNGRVYVNFLADEDGDRVRAAYGPAKYERLAALKRRYDPANVFRLNQNITPAPA